MLVLLTLLVLGMVWVASAIVDNKASRESLYGERVCFLPLLQAGWLFIWLMFPCLKQLYPSKMEKVGIMSIVRLKF